VVAGTPIDLAALVKANKPIVRARYGYVECGAPSLALVDAFRSRTAAAAKGTSE
jgi:predicted GTPase